MNDRIIYDVGMNNGDDTAYYLAKGYRVVAIEASPQLCAAASARFENEIGSGGLIILNVGVDSEPGHLPFYVHKTNSVLSTFVPFGERIGFSSTLIAAEFDAIHVDVKRLSDIINFFGKPEYVKIDVEGFDAICLRDLDRHHIYPRYLSAEAHSIESFCNLVAMGYDAFKVVLGDRVAEDYCNHQIHLADGGTTFFKFNHHSAGPFGDDIPGKWLNREGLARYWCQRGGGWYDIHATRKSYISAPSTPAHGACF